MSMPAMVDRRVTIEEYRAIEARSEVRHELFEGEMFAMAGGTRVHAFLGTSFSGELRNALRGQPCFPCGSDLRVHVDDENQFYPDVTVVCPPVEAPEGDRCSVSNPTLVVEVLSESTMRWDLFGKFDVYRRLASLRHYVLVHTDAWRIEHYRRTESGEWVLTVHTAGDSVAMEALGVSVGVDAVYAGVELLGGPERSVTCAPAPVEERR